MPNCKSLAKFSQPSWFGISNRTFRVQHTGNLSGTNWTDLAGDVFATGATASQTDTTPGAASERFYRAVLLPRSKIESNR